MKLANISTGYWPTAGIRLPRVPMKTMAIPSETSVILPWGLVSWLDLMLLQALSKVEMIINRAKMYRGAAKMPSVY